MKLLHYALAFMLLLTACSKDDDSFNCTEEMWTSDRHPAGVVITSTDAFVVGYHDSSSQWIWLDYGTFGSLQDIDINNIPVMSEIDYNRIPIQENHGYIMKYQGETTEYTAYYITEIHRDKDGNALYIKCQYRGFVPYERWK